MESVKVMLLKCLLCFAVLQQEAQWLSPLSHTLEVNPRELSDLSAI